MIKKSLPKKIGPKKKESDATKIKKKQTSYMIRKADLEGLPAIDKKIKALEHGQEILKYYEFTDMARENEVIWELLPSGSMSLLSSKNGKHLVFLCDKKTPNQYKIFKLNQLLGKFD
jgi:hypothetical protein